MVERETTVDLLEGLHARPAAEVMVRKEEANAKSSLKPMSLGAQNGDKILTRAEGDDARQAVDTLVERLRVED